MAKVKSLFIVYRGKKLALGCGVCAYANDAFDEKNRRCLRCIDGSKKSFALDKKYRDAKQGEHEVDPSEEEENEHATI